MRELNFWIRAIKQGYLDNKGVQLDAGECHEVSNALWQVQKEKESLVTLVKAYKDSSDNYEACERAAHSCEYCQHGEKDDTGWNCVFPKKRT